MALTLYGQRPDLAPHIIMPTDAAHGKITRGTPAFRAIAICMVLAGLSTFALMNCVQPLMPLFTQAFAITPAQASLSLSVNIGVLALLMPFASLVSERFGRKPVLVCSLLSSAVICLLSASATNWHLFLLYRALQGPHSAEFRQLPWLTSPKKSPRPTPVTRRACT